MSNTLTICSRASVHVHQPLCSWHPKTKPRNRALRSLWCPPAKTRTAVPLPRVPASLIRSKSLGTRNANHPKINAALRGGGPTPTIQNVINYIFIRTPVHKCNLLHFLWGVSVESHGFWCSKMFDDAAESGWNPEHAWTIVKWRWLAGRVRV